MQKILTLLSLITISNVQSSIAQIEISPNIGMSSASTKIFATSNYAKITSRYESNTGYSVGVATNLDLTKTISLRSELNVIQKGGQKIGTFKDTLNTPSGNNLRSKTIMRLTYLEFPIHIILNVPAEDGEIFLGAGPTFGFGVNGKIKNYLKGSTNTLVGETSVTFDNNSDAKDKNIHYNFLDLSIGVSAGYRSKNGYQLRLAYNKGLSDIDPYNNSKTTSSCFSATVGYFFKSKK